jgi:xylan 1,4-beta-xylosidase
MSIIKYRTKGGPGVFMHLLLMGVLSIAINHQILCQSPESGSKGYTNPVIRGYNPDPSICRVGEDYYMITSSSYLFPGIPVYHSHDLIHWKMIGHCLTRPEQYFLDKNNNHPEMYAGTLRYNKGIFYMVTTDVNGGGNFFVTATDPAGPWSDPVCIDKPVFDPSLFFDEDGKVYYTRRGDFADKDIVQAEIEPKTGKLLTPLKHISKGLVGDDTEGPHLFRANGWYYLTMGEGGSRYLHMQSIARSKSPWGPFMSCPWNPVISQHNGWWHHTAALGHADFIEDHLGNWWAVCLGQRKAGYMDFCVIGRETFLFPVEWKQGWPFIKTADLLNLSIQTRTLPIYPWPELPLREDFNNKDLALFWNLMAYPFEKVYSLTARPGYLRLYGTVEPVRQSKQVSFIGRRQEEMAGEVTASMEFEPLSPNEEAGLTVYQSAEYQYAACITIRGGQKFALLRKTVGNMVTESERVWITAHKIKLKITFDNNNYHFSVAETESVWKELGTGLINLISTDVAGTFGGVVIGPYATGNGIASKSPADFDWVDTEFKFVTLTGF